ncbi:HTH-type transcriptional regulator BetI [Alphaproteobacteria bacterium SO-S41]|nr:HTH-type transcriptional regulator BetI [Alphaproteobacteria bacterium SO-S41]
MKPQQKSAYHHGDLKEALVEATREIIESEGLDQFTMRESARRAGVSHGAPAHHFGDKTGLLTELAVQSFEARVAQSEAYMAEAGDDPMARLRACGLAHIDYTIRHPRLHELCSRPDMTNRDDPHLQAVITRMSEMLIATMSEVAGHELKPEKEANPETLLALVVVHGFAALVNDGMILADVPDAERPARARVLAEGVMGLLEKAFRAPRE